jgi:hypothetical protein
LDPYHGGCQSAITRFFPCHIGLLLNPTGSTIPRRSAQRLLSGTHFAAAVICSSSGLRVCCHPGRSHRSASDTSDADGGRGLYVRAQHGSLPPRASDMLAVRNRAIDGTGLSPTRLAALPAVTRISEPRGWESGVRIGCASVELQYRCPFLRNLAVTAPVQPSVFAAGDRRDDLIKRRRGEAINGDASASDSLLGLP